MPKIKTLLNWQMAFIMLGFSKRKEKKKNKIGTYITLAFWSQFSGYNSGLRKQCKPIRITVQYNRVQ